MELVGDSDVKIKGIFTFFGEGRQDEIDLHFAGVQPFDLRIVNNKKDKSEIKIEDIFLMDSVWTIEHYCDETGIIKLGITPAVPLWVMNNFASWFIPVFAVPEN